MRGWRQDHRDFAARHKRTIVLEWGYFDRINDKSNPHKGHWQLSPDGLNNLPIGVFPSDRLDATGVQLLERSHNQDGYVLICGQVRKDAAVMDVDYPAWISEQIRKYTARGERILFRPHPGGGTERYGVADRLIQVGDLQSALDGAKFVVCYNSNAGHDALLAGVPVVCDPAAPYYELSGEVCPSIEDRRRYFSRCAYGQWRRAEIADGMKATLESMGYGGRF